MKTRAEIVERLLSEEAITAEEAVVLLRETVNAPIQPCSPYIPVIGERSDDMVPYGEICPCNPANGGSGICNCIMGNRLVPKVGSGEGTGNWEIPPTTDNFTCNNTICFCDGSCKKG